MSSLGGVFLLFTALTVTSCSLIYFSHLALRKNPKPTPDRSKNIHLSENTEIPLPPTHPIVPLLSKRNWTRCDATDSDDRYYCSQSFKTKIYDHPKNCHLEDTAESIEDCYRRLEPTGDKEYAATWIRKIDKSEGTIQEPKRLKLYDCTKRLSGIYIELDRYQNYSSYITPKEPDKAIMFTLDYQLFPDPPKSPVTPESTDEIIFRHACASPEELHGTNSRELLSSPPA